MAPFTVELACATSHQAWTAAQLPDTGEVDCAAMGAGRTCVRVLDRDGRVLEERFVQAALASGPRRQAGGMTVDVAPPLPVLVRGPQGLTIEGATIARIGLRACDVLAVTAADST